MPPSAITRRLSAMRTQTPSGFVRLGWPVMVERPLEWLRAQSVLPRFYWRSRGKDACEHAGIGCAHLVTATHEWEPAASPDGVETPRYFGGLAFDAEALGWPGFGACRFVLPRLELEHRAGRAVLYLNLYFDGRDRDAELDAAEAALNALRPALSPAPLTPTGFTRHDRPSAREWAEWITQATLLSDQARTPKVVLSRESRLATAQPVDPWILLNQWRQLAGDCFHFGFQFAPEAAFIGCSPERLYRREGTRLLSEALAGTSRRDGDPARDAALAAELLADPKNRRENQLVHADILARLAPLSHHASLAEPGIVKLRALQHIRRDIEAELHPWVRDRHLLAALHPTPAVGGTPRDAALKFIRRHESHRRGWYAGACGMLSHETTELTVAIRCARVTAGAVTLYAGAGIVIGSVPAAEWDELEAKIADVMSLLG
ncbi:isochorismate synthase [Billgrantia endophytica]|uniref:Isochorismate synthase MenF n=1 Tax=Billgrantia endophytica TaxID=2033802 RepID=A0A2N7U3X6_9GAMM|nr:isochorismate synthase [Halomonas endophytica]PMR75123.1 isochorismate synthase [Halomonas endophytica]